MHHFLNLSPIGKFCGLPLFLLAGIISGCSSQHTNAAPVNAPVAQSTPSSQSHAEIVEARATKFQVVKSYPHDTRAFTQGLLWHDGALYESTGGLGTSSLRRVDLATGKVLQVRKMPDAVFAEGLALVDGRLIQISWKNQQAFVYDRSTFELLGQWKYEGEGWGLTYDGKSLVMSDGTEYLTWRDPKTFVEQKRLAVTYNGKPLRALNELEWINGEIWANVWQTDFIVRINPESGEVTEYLDCSKLLPENARHGSEDVLNGIAYDADTKRIFITGKLWPRVFEIKLHK